MTHSLEKVRPFDLLDHTPISFGFPLDVGIFFCFVHDLQVLSRVATSNFYTSVFHIALHVGSVMKRTWLFLTFIITSMTVLTLVSVKPIQVLQNATQYGNRMREWNVATRFIDFFGCERLT